MNLPVVLRPEARAEFDEAFDWCLQCSTAIATRRSGRRGPDNLSYLEDVTMELSTDQMRALENGEAVPITIKHTRCVILRTDVYERVQALLDIEDDYPPIDETFREGWEAPGMADYDRYDALKQP